jgi:hypothetical protein
MIKFRKQLVRVLLLYRLDLRVGAKADSELGGA